MKFGRSQVLLIILEIISNNKSLFRIHNSERSNLTRYLIDDWRVEGCGDGTRRRITTDRAWISERSLILRVFPPRLTRRFPFAGFIESARIERIRTTREPVFALIVRWSRHRSRDRPRVDTALSRVLRDRTILGISFCLRVGKRIVDF